MCEGTRNGAMVGTLNRLSVKGCGILEGTNVKDILLTGFTRTMI